MFEATNDSERVRYPGRWASAKTCEVYVQEVGGHHMFAQFLATTLERVDYRALQALEKLQSILA